MRKFLFVLLCLSLALWVEQVRAVEYPPGIFLNDVPGAIEIRQGQTPVVPIFLLMGPYTNQEVEFFVWREWQGEGPVVGKEYLDADLVWHSFEDAGAMTPVAKAALGPYLHLTWASNVFLAPFDWEVNPPPNGLSYNLYVCLDARVDGHPPSEEEFASDPPQAVCTSSTVVFLSGGEETCEPSSVEIQGAQDGVNTRFFAGFAPFYLFPVVSDCGVPSCRVVSRPSFVEASFEEANLRISFSQSLSPGSYQGELRVACEVAGGEREFRIPVQATVDPVPGNCAGTLLLKDTLGQEYQSGATIYLTTTKTFQVVCRQKVLIIEGETVLPAYAFSWDAPCLEARNVNGNLVLTPTGQEGCEAHFAVGAGEARASYTVRRLEDTRACSPMVTPTSLTFTGSGSKTVTVKDSCGNALSYRVSRVSASWITSPRVGATGSGTLTVTVSTTGLSAGTYQGQIEVIPADGDPVTISVSLTVTATVSTLTVWPPEVDVSLEAGTRTTETITVTCSGRVPASCTATKGTGGDWLQVAGCDGSLVSVTLDATGLTSGQTYTGSVNVSTSCGSKTVPVTLTVSGVCEPSTVKLSTTTVLVSTQVGSSPAAQTVSVTDNCGQALSFDVTGVTYSPSSVTGWLSYTASEGSLSLSFDTASLEVGTYQATISLSTTLGEATVTVELTVTDTPTVTVSAILLPGYPDLYSGTFNGGEAKLFYFTAPASSSLPLSVNVQVPSSYSVGYLNMLLVNAGPDCSAASPPTVAQIEDLISQYEAGLIPSSGSSGNTYWYLGGNLTKRISIYQDISSTCWYLLVYNSSSTTYNYATVSYTSP